LKELPELVGAILSPEAFICESVLVRVAAESSVDFRETEVDVEREESGENGFGADAKFLNDGSDIVIQLS